MSTSFMPTDSSRIRDNYIAVSRTLGANPLTSAGVTNVLIATPWPNIHFTEAQLLFGGTVPAGTVGATAKLRKRKTDGSFIDLTAAQSIFSRAQYDVLQFARAAGTTYRDWLLAVGELLFLTIDNTGGTITTQPVDLAVSAKCSVAR